MVEHFIGGAVAEHLAGADHVAAVGDRQRLPLAVIRDQDRDSIVPQPRDDLLDLMNRDRVDAREWLVEENDPRLGHQTAGDLQPPLLTPRNIVRLRPADPPNVKLLE